MVSGEALVFTEIPHLGEELLGPSLEGACQEHSHTAACLPPSFLLSSSPPSPSSLSSFFSQLFCFFSL